MKTMTGILCGMMVLGNLVSAQIPSPSPVLQLNTIYAGADGKFEAAPDTALLRLDVAAQQDTSRAAYDKTAVAVDRVRQVLKNNAIDVKTAQFGFYQMQPVYDWKDPKHRVLGYRVVTDVTLKLHDFAKVGALTEQLAAIEDTQNQSLTYTLDDIEQAKAKASEDGLRKARNQANAVAVAGGRSLGELLYASVDVNQPNIFPVMMNRAMASPAASLATPPPPADFTPQTVTINAHINALFALK